MFRNNKLWTAHTVFFPSSSPTRSSIMWWQIDTAGTPNQVGLIDATNQFHAFPSIAVTAADDALIGYSYITSTTYPAAAYSLRLSTDPLDSMRQKYIYRHGKNSYYETFGGAKNRWGDYSGTCVDPSNDMDLWTVQESVANLNVWDTWWAKVKTNTVNPHLAVSQEADVAMPTLSIVPNPNDGSFNLVFENDIDEKVPVYIVNMEGRVVYSKEYEVNRNNRIAIETTGLANGNYILNAVVDGTSVSRKITVTR
jgi:hypothetical protein